MAPTKCILLMLCDIWENIAQDIQRRKSADLDWYASTISTCSLAGRDVSNVRSLPRAPSELFLGTKPGASSYQ